jgi:hypothetical protein
LWPCANYLKDLTLLPTSIVGTRPNAKYCSLRAPMLSGLAITPLTEQWVTIRVQQYIQLKKGLPPSRRMYAMRAHCYKTLNVYLQDPTKNFKEAFFGIFYAQLSDYLLGQSPVSDMHISALDSLLYTRGGISGFIEESFLESFYLVAMYCFGRCRLANDQVLSNLKSRWLRTMKELEISHELGPCSGVHPCSNIKCLYELQSLVWHVIHIESTAYPAACFRFVLVYDLLLTIKHLRSHVDALSWCVQTIVQLAQDSLAIDSPEVSPLQAGSLASIVSHVRQEAFAKAYDKREATRRTTEIVSAEIDGLKIFATMSTLGRHHLMSQLTSWLFDE